MQQNNAGVFGEWHGQVPGGEIDPGYRFFRILQNGNVVGQVVVEMPAQGVNTTTQHWYLYTGTGNGSPYYYPGPKDLYNTLIGNPVTVEFIKKEPATFAFDPVAFSTDLKSVGGIPHNRQKITLSGLNADLVEVT